ncbi:MAG: SDR family oxidoreductase [Proteobacteria bacterium]|nr:SDR family oxidoreductase [Pseudomonadota bacterium]HQR02975.1 SDR family oxidoreductase [Rhodocyclaceae bacterium]
MSTWSTVQYDYRGAHVLVTGGSHGIGAGIAAAYRAAGAEVTITGTRPAATDYDDDLTGYHYRPLQLTDNARIDALAESLPRLDILVNNAGTNFMVEDEYRPEVFAKSVQVNLLAAYRLAHGCREKLAQSKLPGGASVIGIASMTAFFGGVYTPGYGAAKAGIVELAKTLAIAWAADGIRCNAVAPGFIRSNMMKYFESTPSMVEPVLARTPAGRMGTPTEIAAAVLFLTSDSAAFINGQTLAVDGGYTVVG